MEVYGVRSVATVLWNPKLVDGCEISRSIVENTRIYGGQYSVIVVEEL